MNDIPLQVASWPWYYVAVYFFIGGIAAGCYLIAAIADLFGDEADAPIIKTGHYVAFVLITISPILLTLDLGRPERFWHMLTQFKLLSPVSLGSWGLTTFALFATLSAGIWLAQDGWLKWLKPIENLLLSLPRKLIVAIGTVFGFFVSGYTGVLLSSTTNPFWNSNQFLGISFLTSAISTAIAVLCLLLMMQGKGALIGLHNFRDLWLTVLAFEFFLIVWEIFHEEGTILFSGEFLYIFGVGVVLIGVVLPMAILTLRIGRPMPSSLLMLTALFVLVGGFAFRYSILVAGQQFVNQGMGEHAQLMLSLWG